jgi:hypothetical protein
VKLSEIKHAKDTMVKEDFPRPGVSSGAAKKLKSNAKIKTKEMTLDEILKTVKGIPYVDYVIKDYDDNDYSWEVMEKVKEYADHLLLHPRTIVNLPPILVIDGQLNDGAHRISTLNLLQKRMDPDNPFWKQVKLKVNFAKADDVEPDMKLSEITHSAASDTFVVQGSDDILGALKASLMHDWIIVDLELVSDYDEGVLERRNALVAAAKKVTKRSPKGANWLITATVTSSEDLKKLLDGYNKILGPGKWKWHATISNWDTEI